MEVTEKILLNSSINKKSVNENSSLTLNLTGNEKLLPEDSIDGTIDAYDVYIDERKKSNKFRLVVNINPFCSNILFNPYTEIVKNEGTDDVKCLNFESGYIDNNIIGKDTNFVWNQYQAIRDTQLSSERFGFDYHCGIDIFNNHIIRNKVFKAVNYNDINSTKKIGKFSDVYGQGYDIPVHAGTIGITEGKHKYVSNDFNTIDDYMRDSNGVIVSENFVRYELGSGFRQDQVPLHLYQNIDIMSFEDCVENKLINSNGWYGFKNPFINASVKLDGVLDDYGKYINRTINNKEVGEFIDMYPGRDLYSFTPKYNKYRRRVENNWNYCITYPSKNVVKMNNCNDFPFFRIDSSGNTSLKVYMFDEYTVDDNGESVLTIYTICQHGLMVGDTVNIYKSDDLVYDSVQVLNVVDNFIFQVHKASFDISNEWVETEGDRFDSGGVYQDDNGIYYPICESNRCNVDPNAQDIHIRRVVNGVECKYYVRKFSRLPNFKFKNEEVNDYTLYKEGSDLIERFSDPKDWRSNFESHIGKLGFANTAYGDDSVEIVFTDDFDTSFLKDNLGRPLSDLYLTIVKNNKGYKKWYGIDEEFDLGSEEVEYSHCFGKIHDSFVLSDYYREWYNIGQSTTLYDVRDLTYGETKDLGEVEIGKDYEYYGDICCYSPIDCDEQSLQMSMHRFNTVQRELSNINPTSKSLTFFRSCHIATGDYGIGRLCHDEIQVDENKLTVINYDYEVDPFEAFENGPLNHSVPDDYKDMLSFKEGYYYQPHYRIPIKTVSNTLNTEKAIEYEIYSISSNEIKTVLKNSFSKNEKLMLYNRSTNKAYNVVVIEPIDLNKFTCEIVNSSGLDFANVNDYVLLKKPENIPDYANVILDGFCRYGWRNVVSNGIEENENIYPFTNGAFYIKRSINFFLRRQDPQKEHLGDVSDDAFDYVPDGEDINNYHNFSPSNKINYNENEFDPC